MSRTMYLVVVVTLFLQGSAYGDYKDPHCDGNRNGIVHLFEWKWNDIANECKNFLGPYGFCGVQTSPPSENRIVLHPNRPWWERYQPVSYKLNTRSGNEAEFKNMVKTCNDNGVRIFADVILNHMTGSSAGTGNGTGGSSFDANKMLFPGVPYGPNDFNERYMCPSYDWKVHDYHNKIEVRNCRLTGLLDVGLGKTYVRQVTSKYMNHLVDLGVAGFRLDSAKHMWPADLDPIMKMVKDVQMGGRPFVYQQIVDENGNEAVLADEYLKAGRVTNFRFGKELSKVFRKQNAMKWLSNWGTAWHMWKSGDVLTFIDSHDTQRGHGISTSVLTHWESRPYKLATAFMLAHPYGLPRIMSSFNFNRANDWEGPPHNGDNSIKSVKMDGHVCKDGWVCEHRWRQIYNMVAFRNMAQGNAITNWWSGADYQIAFSRGSKAFIAFNLESYDLKHSLQTGLPAGTYCDVISGNIVNGMCTGKSVTVGANGMANIDVCSRCEDPMVAYHVGAKIGSTAKRLNR